MESVSRNAALQGSYLYNAMGQKVRKTAAGVTTNVIHDAQGRRIAEYNASGNTLIREYLWLGDKPLAVIEGGAINYIRADNINRPVFATNAAGTKIWTASYLPFGGVVASTGTPINLRFPGQWFQPSPVLHQNWMRDYDPTTGRYLQADPLGLVDGSSSVYGYAGQSPLRNVDPNGLTISPFDFDQTSGMPRYEPVPELQYCISDCDDEWIVARNICISELSKPSPNRGITGGYNDIASCARGLVSVLCGGNPLAHSELDMTTPAIALAEIQSDVN